MGFLVAKVYTDGLQDNFTWFEAAKQRELHPLGFPRALHRVVGARSKGKNQDMKTSPPELFER
jgi:hypothetical protein